jgi:4a-hydroxytetrahydrobiopterin dehydratase
MKLKKQEIDLRMSKLQGWQLSGDTIKKEYKFKDFSESMAFVVKIALEAEKVQHHPDMTIEYSRVKIVLTTYSEEGLTSKDFDLAEKIDTFVGA